MVVVLQTTFQTVSENARISIKIHLMFVPKGPINNIPPLAKMMAWRRPGNSPLSELILLISPPHIGVTRPEGFDKMFGHNK